MRVLYIDIDSLRPDHLGCYGYQRDTSPNIDALAHNAVRFDACYVSDAPCLPSRTAMWSGRYGFRTGVVGHGGTAATPFRPGLDRGFRDLFGNTGWMATLRTLGTRTVTVSSFGERHSAWHWYAGFNEIHNPGQCGAESAHDVAAIALDWLNRHGQGDDWFLHVNFWDPHTAYRVPIEYGNPFTGEPLPDWLTEEVRQRCWNGFGPHSAQEPQGYDAFTDRDRFPRMPAQIDSPEALRQWIDGYDTGVRYADDYIGRIVDILAAQGVLDETAIFVSADHGENLGELNVWGDHQTADQWTCRVPLIVRWPGITDAGRVDGALHEQFDWAATMLELLGAEVPAGWDGQSFASAFRAGREDGRPFLVTSQGAWACQRGVRFGHWLCLRTWHDGYKELEPVMLFDLATDPHEQQNVATAHPDVVDLAMRYLSEWRAEMAQTSPSDIDPLMTVLRQGGPFHTRGELPAYLARLRATGRARHADRLAARHPAEAATTQA